MIQNSTVSIATNSNVTVKSIVIIKSSINVILNSSLISNGIRLIYGKNTTNVLNSVNAKALYIRLGKIQISEVSNILVNSKKYFTSNISMVCKSNLECYSFIRDLNKEIKAYLPGFLLNSDVINNVLNVNANEFTKLNSLILDLQMQFNPQTATWSIPLWEAELYITPRVNATQEQRRADIMYKIQTNSSVITKNKFKEMMDRYYTCEVTEDFQNSKIDIKVIGKRGIPDTIIQMENDADIFLPGHLIYEFIYTYLPWNELEGSNMTWNEAETYTWDKLETTFL